MKLNNKGFTVVELLASFILTMIIVVFLFEIVLELRNLYLNESVKTASINENALVVNAIHNNLNGKIVTGSNCTGTKCTITHNEGSLVISVSGKTVTVGSQKFEYPEKANLQSVSLTKVGPVNTGAAGINSYFKISYVINSADLDDDINFNYVYPYVNGGYVVEDPLPSDYMIVTSSIRGGSINLSQTEASYGESVGFSVNPNSGFTYQGAVVQCNDEQQELNSSARSFTIKIMSVLG